MSWKLRGARERPPLPAPPVSLFVLVSMGAPYLHACFRPAHALISSNLQQQSLLAQSLFLSRTPNRPSHLVPHQPWARWGGSGWLKTSLGNPVSTAAPQCSTSPPGAGRPGRAVRPLACAHLCVRVRVRMPVRTCKTHSHGNPKGYGWASYQRGTKTDSTHTEVLLYWAYVCARTHTHTHTHAHTHTHHAHSPPRQ